MCLRYVLMSFCRNTHLVYKCKLKSICIYLYFYNRTMHTSSINTPIDVNALTSYGKENFPNHSMNFQKIFIQIFFTDNQSIIHILIFSETLFFKIFNYLFFNYVEIWKKNGKSFRIIIKYSYIKNSMLMQSITFTDKLSHKICPLKKITFN